MKSDSGPAPHFDAELLHILACPKCKGSLTLNAAMHTLDCGACRLRYPLNQGIPILLLEAAAAF